LIFIGGIQRIASVAEKIVPFMAVLYLLGGLVVLVIRWQYVPETFAMIFKYAFAPNAILGGGIGYAIKSAISQGAKRGLFSNEAGMGSTPHAHAMAEVEKPHDQGVVAMIGVFIDTFLVLTMTALVVISTLYTGDGILANVVGGDVSFAEQASALGVEKSNMMQVAYASIFGSGFGNSFVAICLLFFAFTTIIGWNFFGKINAEYLFGKKFIPVYTVLALVFIFFGSCLSNDLVWALTDMFNNIMVIPNVIALVALSAWVAKIAKNAKKK
ncbi:MAG: alanine:cation symporter family protein, partial [Clostridia bacterium]|nr:alanine:cation symporter family protein [Clostridia bacterium]